MKKSNWDVIIDSLRKNEIINKDVDGLTKDQIPWIAEALVASWDRAWTLGMIEWYNYTLDQTDDTDAVAVLTEERNTLLRRKQEKGW